MSAAWADEAGRPTRGLSVGARIRGESALWLAVIRDRDLDTHRFLSRVLFGHLGRQSRHATDDEHELAEGCEVSDVMKMQGPVPSPKGSAAIDFRGCGSYLKGSQAQVAELVDALASGASARKGVEVRVFSWAPFRLS